MRRQDSVGGEALLEDRKLLEDIWETSSTILHYYSLVKLTAREMLDMTEAVGHKSNQLQALLQISQQQLGRPRDNYYNQQLTRSLQIEIFMSYDIL